MASELGRNVVVIFSSQEALEVFDYLLRYLRYF